MCQLIGEQQTKHDLWLLFEVCEGEPLSKLLWTKSGDFYNSERIYKVLHNDQNYQILTKDDCFNLKIIIIQIIQALDLLRKAKIVHFDIKPDNIIVQLDYESQSVKSVKVIDLGSSFEYE